MRTSGDTSRALAEARAVGRDDAIADALITLRCHLVGVKGLIKLGGGILVDVCGRVVVVSIPPHDKLK